jgi:hypothetical protein
MLAKLANVIESTKQLSLDSFLDNLDNFLSQLKKLPGDGNVDVIK